MASIYKNIVSNRDVNNTTTILSEAIPITGTVVSGAYDEENIKNYAHGMFQSVYDYPYASSSANHIFDLTVGYSPSSPLSASASVQNSKKINMYNQMAQVLVGYDQTGAIREFDNDGNLADSAGKMQECIFVNLSRLLTKDEVKKGSVVLTFLTGGTPVAPTDEINLYDGTAATTGYFVNSPAGEYAPLFSNSAGTGDPQGLIYYQGGIAVLTASVFDGQFGSPSATYDTSSVDAVLTGSEISSSCDGLRNRVVNIEFQNTTELHSTIYHCRAHSNEFNYSSNQTYLTSSQIVVKGGDSKRSPVSYVTSVGLYSADNELLAVAKLSEPLKKTPANELTLRLRLDW